MVTQYLSHPTNLFHVPLNGLKHLRGNDLAESSNGNWAVDSLRTRHILGQTEKAFALMLTQCMITEASTTNALPAGHDDHVVGEVAELLDRQIDKQSQSDILRLPELRGRKERVGRLRLPNRLAIL